MSTSRRCSGSIWRSERRVALILALASALAGVGCGLTPAEWFERDAYFVEAVPDSRRTRIDVTPRSVGGGEPAVTLAVMEPLAEELNGLTLSVLRVAEFITAEPPSDRGEGHRLWGPDYSPLYDVSYELYVEEVEASRFEYELAVAAGVESELDRVLLDGGYSGAALGDGSGRFTLDLDAAGDVLPGVFAPPRHGGSVTVAHRIAPGELEVGIDLAATEVDDAAGAPLQIAGQYAFVEDAAGGQLCFDAAMDVFGGSGVEDLFVVARWQADGAGRADGSLGGGEVGSEVQFVECWDGDGMRVYWYDSGGQVEGTPADCVIDDNGSPDLELLPSGCDALFPPSP